MKKLKKNIIPILCGTIVVLVVGFILLAVKLKNEQSIPDVFDVSFVNIKKTSSIKGGKNDPYGNLEITSLGKVINMNFDLFEAHDEIDYEITIVNNGTVSASIVELLMSPDFTDKGVIEASSPIKITISDISGKILDPGEEATAKLSIIYYPENVPNPKKTSKKSISGKIGLITESNTNS